MKLSRLFESRLFTDVITVLFFVGTAMGTADSPHTRFTCWVMAGGYACFAATALTQWWFNRKASLWLGAVALCLILPLAGCTSYSYKAGVRSTYPKVATRIDGIIPETPAAQNLRDAATDPISYGKASAAWVAAAPVYRAAVTSAPNLTAHRRADWLTTADLLDKLNADEAKHERLIFFPAPAVPPAPTTQP